MPGFDDSVHFLPKSLALVIPTLNAGPAWDDCLLAIRKQSISPDLRIVIDSASVDSTREKALYEGFIVHTIDRREFDHGGTRQWGVELAADSDFIVFLTQDAILARNDSLENLLDPFKDPRVAIVYGRQLPRPEAGPIEAHARYFNYPPDTQIRDQSDISRLGIKSAFVSNSFAAYRKIALNDVGGFPRRQTLGEDVSVGGKSLMKGWKIVYQSEATVFHSHDLTVPQEFQRYYRIGQFHSENKWLMDYCGRPENEGFRFVLSEIRYLWNHAPSRIPEALLRTGSKLFGYRLGRWVHASRSKR